MNQHSLQEEGRPSRSRRTRLGGPNTAVGIDLSADERRASGVAVTDGRWVWTGLLRTDGALVAWVRTVRPGVVAVDAPLWLPPGRRDVHDRRGGHLRPCDWELLRRGIRFFPITLGAMRKLTERGLRLRSLLEAEGWRVIEVFPGGAQDVLGLPRKHRDLAGLRVGLRRLGLRGIRSSATHDELDAATAAYVGWLFLQGRAEVLGDWTHGAIVMPRPNMKGRSDEGTG
jgi:predicted nuclease with RNAse H fold